MPKAKREKKISLTKTKRKGLELKQKMVEKIQNFINEYSYIYAFEYVDIRNDKIGDMRNQWPGSRFVFGKKRIIALGLGKSAEDEPQNDLHLLGKAMEKGKSCALLFTNEKPKKVSAWFREFKYTDFARAGFKTETKIELPIGPLLQFSHAMEPYLRKLGMPTELNKGIVALREKFVICEEGMILSPERAKILELLDFKLADFFLVLLGVWNNKTGFKHLDASQN